MEWKAIFVGVIIGAAAAFARCQMMAKGGFKMPTVGGFKLT